MDAKDVFFLKIQFQIKVYSLFGTPFQNFFESLMKEGFDDFSVVRSARGDGGNDGFRKPKGIYYQVYSPMIPETMRQETIEKLTRDFEKLKASWDPIVPIKEYVFVFNDKYTGTTLPFERALAELQRANPTIIFSSLFADDLEKLFFSLTPHQVQSLGFSIDSRLSLKVGNEVLDALESELDKENVISAERQIVFCEGIVANIQDAELFLRCSLLKARLLRLQEKIPEAKAALLQVLQNYPKDPRPELILAEIYIQEGSEQECNNALERVERIAPRNPLLGFLRQLQRALKDPHEFAKSIDSISLPSDTRIKAALCRLFSKVLTITNDFQTADKWLSEAIAAHPERLANQTEKCISLASKIQRERDHSTRISLGKCLIEELGGITRNYDQSGEMAVRSKALLQQCELYALWATNSVDQLEKRVEEQLDRLLACYIDRTWDFLLLELMSIVHLRRNQLNKLFTNLSRSSWVLSEPLAKMFLLQIVRDQESFSDGKKALDARCPEYLWRIFEAIEANNGGTLMVLLSSDRDFMAILAHNLSGFPVLQDMLVNVLPESAVNKKIRLSIAIQRNHFEDALAQLRTIDYSSLEYPECWEIVALSRKNHAWDIEFQARNRILQLETDKKRIQANAINLFWAACQLGQNLDVIELGKKLLGGSLAPMGLSDSERQDVVGQMIQVYLTRNEREKAFEVLTKNPIQNPSLPFSVAIVAKVLDVSGKHQEAMTTIVNAVRKKGVLTPEEYGKLFFVFVMQEEKGEDRRIGSLETVEDGCFVKLKGKNRWYYLGERDELDATRVPKSDPKYNVLLGKKLGERFQLEKTYTSQPSEDEIENVLPIEKYIIWQARQNFHELTIERRWQHAWIVEVPTENGHVNLDKLKEFMKDEEASRDALFQMYCSQPVPLAMLAKNEGGLINAVGKIRGEEKGFIKFWSGEEESGKKQLNVAKKIIEEGHPFYLDGTSALFLGERGLLDKLVKIAPKIRVPQSVVNFLYTVSERFRREKDENIFIGFHKGEIRLNRLSRADAAEVYSNFSRGIKAIEEDPSRIVSISAARKNDCFSEDKIPPEMCDACILAQYESIPIVTEDFLYLQMNEIETKKVQPEFSSIYFLFRTILAKGLTSFQEYLELFAFLSSYRFRFLAICIEDMEKALFGDGKFPVVRPTNMRLFNFHLTLSEEYGVPFVVAANILCGFFLNLIRDNNMFPEGFESVLVETIHSLPVQTNKRRLIHLLHQLCSKVVNEMGAGLVCIPKNEVHDRKLQAILRAASICS